MTSDKYIDAVKIFMWFTKKYWWKAPQVVVSGFSAPEFQMPEGSTWMSVGRFEDYPIGRWSDAFIATLERLDDELIIVMLEDYWVTREVDLFGVLTAAEYCRRHPEVIKFDLTGDRLYAHGADLTYDAFGHLDVIKSMPGSPYHMSLMTGIWRRESLLKVLQPGWSPWDVEIIGTTVLSHASEYSVVGSRQWPVRHCLGFRSGDASKIDLSQVNGDDVRTLKNLGLLTKWVE